MKGTPLLIFFIGFVSTCYAQVYNDVQQIKSLTTSKTLALTGQFELTPKSDDDLNKLVSILKNYIPQSGLDSLINDSIVPKENKPGVLSQKFNGNPFFRLNTNVKDPNLNISNAFKSAGSPVSKIAGLDVTTVADGIARFLVERTKQELNVYFFDQFKKFLEDSTYGKDIQYLFPNTYSVLLVLGDEVYNYQQYLQSMREAFAQDLAALLVNVNSWVTQVQPNSPVVQKIQKSELYKYLQLALLIAVDLHQGKHPGDILSNLAGKDFLIAIDPDVSASAKTADLISQSLRSNDGARYWIDTQDFRSFEDPVFLRIYLGLLYQQAVLKPVIKFKNGKSLSEIMTALAQNADAFKLFIQNLKTQLAEIEQVLAQLKNNSGLGVTQNYASLAAHTMKAVYDISVIFPTQITETKLAEDARFIITHATNLMADVRTKSYSASVVELSLILSKLKIENDPFAKGLLKYGTFMANVASAQTSEEVQQAIEVIALPPGSYQVKRESRFNASINGYLGLYAANEYLPASTQKNGFSAGVFAPVGVAFSFGGGNDSQPKKSISHSFLLSVVDVGALASFRFNDSNTSVSSSIQLKDIVAPGFYYILGLPRSPISLGLGAQLGPNLREVDPSGSPNINTDYYIRTGGFIAVDIPFLTLSNRRDKKPDKEKSSKKKESKKKTQ